MSTRINRLTAVARLARIHGRPLPAPTTVALPDRLRAGIAV